MASLCLVRIDSRLIHGQVATLWTKQVNASKIIIIDDETYADKYISKILALAAPQGMKVTIYSIEQAVEQWKTNAFGSGRAFVLFRDIQSAYEAYTRGFVYPDLQIGGMGAAPGRVIAHGPISISEDDAVKLKELSSKGCKIVFRVLPNYSPESWESVKKRVFPNV